MNEVISIQVFFSVTIFVIFQVLLAAADCPAKPLHKIGLQVNCYIGRTINSVSCYDSIEVNTKANISCKYGYQNSRDIKIQEITCQGNCQWSEEPMHCEDLCVDNTDAITSTFVNNKTESILSQTPWHVSILVNTKFRNIYNLNAIRCYGVILNAKLILTIHACIRPFSAYEMTVITGKFKMVIDSVEPYAKRFGIKKIYTNYNFSNNATKFHGNSQLAILELIQPLEYSKFVRSACIDWSAITDEVLNSNPVGFAGYWDDFANCTWRGNYTYKVELNTKEWPVSKHDTCGYEDKKPFDIFCYIVYDDQKLFCYPPAGFGIMLKQELKDGSTRKLLWGMVFRIMSISPGFHENGDYNTRLFRYYHYVASLNIWHQRDFVIEYMEKFNASNILSYEFTNNTCPAVDFYSKKLIPKCEIHFEDTPCDNAIKSETIVSIKCKEGYENPTDNIPEIKCLEGGIWSDEFYQCEQVINASVSVEKVEQVGSINVEEVEQVVNVTVEEVSGCTSKNYISSFVFCIIGFGIFLLS